MKIVAALLFSTGIWINFYSDPFVFVNQFWWLCFKMVNNLEKRVSLQVVRQIRALLKCRLLYETFLSHVLVVITVS